MQSAVKLATEHSTHRMLTIQCNNTEKQIVSSLARQIAEERFHLKSNAEPQSGFVGARRWTNGSVLVSAVAHVQVTGRQGSAF